MLAPDAQILAKWIRDDILINGGSGRRPSKAQLALSWWDEPPLRMQRAVSELLANGWETHEPLPGFIYLVPPEVAQAAEGMES